VGTAESPPVGFDVLIGRVVAVVGQTHFVTLPRKDPDGVASSRIITIAQEKCEVNFKFFIFFNY